MIVTDPIPWSIVPVGAQVLLYDDVPRTVLGKWRDAPHGATVFMIEGMPSLVVTDDAIDTVCMVIMDESDALANLAAAGLNLEIIETKEQ